MTNIDKLQDFYNKMIDMANHFYSLSQNNKYIALQEYNTGRAEAHEADAEVFAESFSLNGKPIVKTVRTLRQQSIEQIYREENEFINDKIYEDVED